MTEKEYIMATNLAKLRLALQAVANATALNEYERELKDNAVTPLSEWMEILEKSIRVRA